jgi:hypothetical protein
LAGAAQADDVEALCEFLLLHAWRLKQVVHESPLDAAVRGDRERASVLADLASPVYGPFWRLLVAWEFSEQERTQDAQATLNWFQEASLSVPRELKPIAFYLLGQCSPIDAEICQTLLKGIAEVENNEDIWRGFSALAPLGPEAQLRWVLEVGKEQHFAEAHRYFADGFALLGEAGREGLRGLVRLVPDYVHENQFRVDAVISLAEAQERVGDEDGALGSAMAALEWARAVTDEGDRSFCLRAIARLVIEAKDRTRWESLLAEVHSMASALVGRKPRMLALAAVAPALVSAGKADAAETAFVEARSLALAEEAAEERAGALAQIAAESSLAGDREGASRDFNEALNIAKHITDEGRRWIAVDNVTNWLLQAGELAQARQVAETCYTRDNSETLLSIVEKESLRGNVSAAREIAFGIANRLRRAQALAISAKALVQTGDKQAAQETFAAAAKAAAGIKDEVEHSSALEAIIRAQVGVGETEAASRNTRDIRASVPRASALLTIAEAMAQAGNGKGARFILAEALDAIRDTGQWQACAESLNALAAVQRVEDPAGSTEARQWTMALATARDIEDPGRRIAALSQIAVHQATAGQHETATAILNLALEAARLLDNVVQRENMLADIAIAQAEAGFVERAGVIAQLVTTSRNRHWPRIAAALLTAASKGHPERATEAKEQLKQLAATSVHNLDLGYRICALLGRLYPRHLRHVAELVAQFGLNYQGVSSYKADEALSN